MPAGIEINPIVLKFLIKKSGITQQEFAELVGVDKITVTRWVWDNASPSEKNIYKICEVLKIPRRLLVMNSGDLLEKARTERVVKFSVNEVLDDNEPADYREVQLILQDLSVEQERESEAEEVREEDFTVSSEVDSSENTESNPNEGDAK